MYVRGYYCVVCVFVLTYSNYMSCIIATATAFRSDMLERWSHFTNLLHVAYPPESKYCISIIKCTVNTVYNLC